MKTYTQYTAEFKNDIMTEDDWDNVDKKHRDIAQTFFTALGATDINFTKGNNCIDMTFRLNGKRISCELKDRDQRAMNFKDVMIEKIKYDSISRRLANNEFDKALAMNHYPDGTIRLANIFSSSLSQRKMWCPNTSYVKGYDIEFVQKDCILLQDFNEYMIVDGKITKK